MDLVVARASERDWAFLKMVRLQALAESPSAFGSTLEREQQYDEGQWRAWARSRATFLAFDAGTSVGMAAGVPTDKEDERQLIAMWVHPDHRGRGVSSALLAAVTDWASTDGATRLTPLGHAGQRRGGDALPTSGLCRDGSLGAPAEQPRPDRGPVGA